LQASAFGQLYTTKYDLMKTRKFTIQKRIKSSQSCGVAGALGAMFATARKGLINVQTQTECGSLSRKTLVRKAIKQFGRHRLNPPYGSIAEALILIKNRLLRVCQISKAKSKRLSVLQSSSRTFSPERLKKRQRSPLSFLK
jgi:hypothetical protein